jgi:uncharacterized protein DUF4349
MKENKMKRTLFIIFSVIAVFLIIGITFTRLTGPKIGQTFSVINNSLPGEGYGGGAPDSSGFYNQAVPSAAQPPAPALEARSSTKDIGNGAAQPVQAQERLVIQNADLAIVVKDPKASMKEISDLAKQYGGFVVSSNLYQSYSPAGKEVPEASIVIRVTSDKLDEALDKIKAGAVDVQSENRSGQDVTSQYVDLQAQLKAKQAAEEKLLEIMDQAVKAEDVLNTYLQVQNVQTEIEQLKGQIKYLEESAALSAISVRLIAEEGTQPIQVGPWRPAGAAKEAIQHLIVFFQNFVEFLISFVLFILPALILIAIPLFLVYLAGRAVYRRFHKSKVDVEEIKG